MKKIIALVMMISALNLFGTEMLDFNFFVDPQFNYDDSNIINFKIKNLQNDSIPQTNFLAGDILKGSNSDSLIINFLNIISPDFALPTDYYFSIQQLNFPILSANLANDSLNIITNKIIRSDSITVGVFGIYSPDFVVKNKINAKLNFEVFSLVEHYSKALAKEVDIVILVSALAKYIDRDIVKDLPVDIVVSFDYMKKSHEKFHSKTDFYSVLSKNGKFGKLRLTYENGEISNKWIVEKLDFDSGQ